MRFQVYKLRDVKGRSWRIRVIDEFDNVIPMSHGRTSFWKWEHALAQAVFWAEGGPPSKR